jgi:RepB DNA-primase N-terminal domain/RepB DNA-primase C-terminal helical domain
MSDRGLSLSLQAMQRQLAAMPWASYRIRLIHHRSRRSFPGSRLWTATQLGQEAIVKFLRARNRDGYDVYFQPYAADHNAGYILVDLDQAEPGVLGAMRAQGHQPCVVVETSPGHLQAWVHVSPQPLPPAVASAIGRQLARCYQGDPASSDWRHVGRLAGFTNQKPQRRLPSGWAPWVKLQYATPGLAVNRRSLLQSAAHALPLFSARPTQHVARPAPTLPAVAVPGAAAVYQSWLQRLRILQRFPHPDWSIADLWIAQQLLWSGLAVAEVRNILQQGSPGFPRHHAAPEDYLHRTLTRARTAIAAAFPARP